MTERHSPSFSRTSSCKCRFSNHFVRGDDIKIKTNVLIAIYIADLKTKHRFGIDTDHFFVFLLVSDSRSGLDPTWKQNQRIFKSSLSEVYFNQFVSKPSIF